MRRGLAAALVAVVVGVLGTVGGATSAAQRPVGDTRVFSRVPGPGFAANVYRHPNGRVYAATYGLAKNEHVPSRVLEWTASGTLLRSWTVPGQNLTVEHGVQVATSDARGRLVLLETSTSSVLTLNLRTGRFVRQAVIPDLARLKGKAVPNYATWGPGGALLISDYGQAALWRIPAGGGRASLWYTSPALEGLGFGTTGLVYRPATRQLLIGQQTTGDLASNPTAGKLYRLAVTAAGRPGAVSTLWRSRTGELPDGFGVARSGRIYVAGVGLSSQIVVLSPAGKELRRIGKAGTGANGSPVPFDGPSNATFVGTRILVANQSPIAGTKEHQVILDVEVGEPGAALPVPERSRLR
ncbi:MAG: SMP-30/gluconolactonase/LRE family protein [Marmoricola sp.]